MSKERKIIVSLHGKNFIKKVKEIIKEIFDSKIIGEHPLVYIMNQIIILRGRIELVQTRLSRIKGETYGGQTLGWIVTQIAEIRENFNSFKNKMSYIEMKIRNLYERMSVFEDEKTSNGRQPVYMRPDDLENRVGVLEIELDTAKAYMSREVQINFTRNKETGEILQELRGHCNRNKADIIALNAHEILKPLKDMKGETWYSPEDSNLRYEVEEAIKLIADSHKRSVGAILSRIKQKGLLYS